MGFETGLLGGFQSRKREVEHEQLRQSERASEREGRIFEALLNSPDPEIQALAASGLLESAQPKKRKGGLRGWLGEMETSPTLSRLQALIQTPVETAPGAPAQPPQTVYPTIPTPPPTLGEAPAGTPAQSLTQPGAAPAPRPQPQQIPGKVATPPTMGPRKIFPTAEDQIRRETLAREGAQTEAELARAKAIGFSPEEYKELERQKVRRATGAVGQTYAEGEIVADPDSPTGFSQTLYLRADPTVRQKIPAGAPHAGSSRAPNVRESIAHELFGKPGEDPRAVIPRLTPDQMKTVLDREVTRQGQTAAGITTARGGAAAEVPLTTQQRFQAITSLQDDWRKVEAPIREMQRQYQLMQVGLRRFNEGDKIGGSQAVLVTFQKVLDPPSVVREAEYARSGAGLSLLNRLEGYVQRLQSGGAGVPPEELAAMVETANQFLRGLEGWNAAEKGRIEETARQFKLDPTLITGSTTVGAAPPTGGRTPAPQSGPPNVFVDKAGNLVYK